MCLRPHACTHLTLKLPTQDPAVSPREFAQGIQRAGGPLAFFNKFPADGSRALGSVCSTEVRGTARVACCVQGGRWGAPRGRALGRFARGSDGGGGVHHESARGNRCQDPCRHQCATPPFAIAREAKRPAKSCVLEYPARSLTSQQPSKPTPHTPHPSPHTSHTAS